jgi:hypothetical protein
MVPRPVAGKAKTLLACLILRGPESVATAWNGLPVAINALPSVHFSTFSGIASLIDIGSDMGKVAGCSSLFAIALTTVSSNVPA